jgi:hypothetical protein
MTPLLGSELSENDTLPSFTFASAVQITSLTMAVVAFGCGFLGLSL